MAPNVVEGDNRPLLVIGAGVCRTGTTSLKSALEHLYQVPCYHMTEITRKHKDHVQLWLQLFDLMEKDPNAKLPEDVVRRIFQGYQLTTDHPACTIYKQLMKIYPDAKVILTVRNPQSWIQSVRQSIRPKIPILDSTMWGRLKERFLVTSGFTRMTDQMLTLTLGRDVDPSDDDQMMQGMIRHNEEVKRTVPADRLLVFQVKEGWEPLCHFLGKPVPPIPFPHLNDREHVRKWIAQSQRRLLLTVTSSILILGLAVALGVWWSIGR